MPLDDVESAISTLPQLAEHEAGLSLELVLEMLIREPPRTDVGGMIEIMGTRWSATWYKDKELYVTDRVTFARWINDTQFEGYGEVTHHGTEYKYSIAGELSRTGIVVLIYKAERFPTEANIGAACLQLSNSAQELEGTWTGFASVKQPDGKKVPTLVTGRVFMERIRNLDP